MWTVIKTDLKKIGILKEDLAKKVGNDSKFFIPLYLVEKYRNKKIIKLKKNLFDNYIFCYNKKFEKKGYFENLKYLKGLKCLLYPTRKDQNEIKDMIDRCKKFENKSGYINQKYFYEYLSDKLEIFEGPLRNMVFNILEKNKNSVSISFGNFKVNVSNKYIWKFKKYVHNVIL